MSDHPKTLKNKVNKLLANRALVLTLFFGLSMFAVVKGALLNHINNNYFVYKYNFINVINQHTIFGLQPPHFQDLNHYGPVFAFIIAPFALMPDRIGVIFWVLFNVFILYLAIKQLPLNTTQKLLVLLICAHELMTSSANEQINPFIGALIIFSFVFIRDKKEFWAAFVIVLGTLIKLYGIVGLAFFFLAENKMKFILSFLFWSAVLLMLPALISSPAYIIKTYSYWGTDLEAKNLANTGHNMQDISVMGLIRNIFHYPQLSNIPVIGPALLLFGLCYIKPGNYKLVDYQLLLLAATLIFVVIFSSSSESPTYIIAFAGVAIWFINLNRPITGFEIFLFAFAFLITSLSPSDLFPRYVRMQYIVPYKLKALPCLLIWLKIIYEMVTRKFNGSAQHPLPAGSLII